MTSESLPGKMPISKIGYADYTVGYTTDRVFKIECKDLMMFIYEHPDVPEVEVHKKMAEDGGSVRTANGATSKGCEYR